MDADEDEDENAVDDDGAIVEVIEFATCWEGWALDKFEEEPTVWDEDSISEVEKDEELFPFKIILPVSIPLLLILLILNLLFNV
jgi:hypothetical protein